MIELAQVGTILGITTLVGALVAQVPQIIAIIKSKNVDGLSFNGFSIEIFSLTIQVLYFVVQEYDLLAYSDISILLVQDYVIVILMLLYGKEALGAREYGNIIGYLVAVASVVVGTVTKDMIVMVMQGVVLLNLASKMTFISSILSTKDTSAMEPAAWIIFVYSNIVRVFVGYLLLGDMTIVGQHAVNGAFNLAITLLIFKYRGGNKEEEEKKEE
ncbi:uncharacterized protein LOC134826038 [Bolinopsis microptera]|uniref:uncharacterized protein LOC134826038 n=1 Tax=Bolinopsis microptera TaxID=2820187 RepID=UPI003078BD5F